MQQLAGRRLPFQNGLSRLAGDADVKRDGHRPSKILVTEGCDEADEPASAARFPVAEHPVRRFKHDALAGLPACGAGFLL